MVIEETKMNDIVQLNVQGKVDALSSQEFQNAVLKAFQKSSNVIVNMADTTYVSSAGLRAIMIGHKTATAKGGKLMIINAGEGVLEVLRVTGLEKVLNIQ